MTEEERLQTNLDYEGGALEVSMEERKKRQEIMARRAGDDLKKKWADGDRAALDAQVKLPPIISEPRCHTCKSEYRVYIEREILKGTSWRAIGDSLPVKIDRRGIAKHYKEHMRVEQATIRAVLEDEANLLSQNVEEGVKGAFTLRGALDVLIRKAYQDALEGITTVEPKDLIQMIKLYNDMNVESGGTAVEEAKTAIRIFVDAIQNVLIKGDIIDRELGHTLLQAINDETINLRQEEDIEMEMERQLRLPRAVD
jgi:hypothetical protein